mmetsp:Transcript_8436/g.22911  ORF Transcript_8436/g.22911 Transcript_8436/m.22911 type:complete len:87 (-) Transcript_8436:737-997(-)
MSQVWQNRGQGTPVFRAEPEAGLTSCHCSVSKLKEYRSFRALPVLPPKRYIESPQITAECESRGEGGGVWPVVSTVLHSDVSKLNW